MTFTEKFGLLGMLTCLFSFNFVPYDNSTVMYIGCYIVFTVFALLFMLGNKKDKK